jgi:hypothetical protein
MFDDIPLHGRPEFKGGILESDQPFREATIMDIETKEIVSTPSTERKDEAVKTGLKTVPDRTPSHPVVETPVRGTKDGQAE